MTPNVSKIKHEVRCDGILYQVRIAEIPHGGQQALIRKDGQAWGSLVKYRNGECQRWELNEHRRISDELFAAVALLLK